MTSFGHTVQLPPFVQPRRSVLISAWWNFGMKIMRKQLSSNCTALTLLGATSRSRCINPNALARLGPTSMLLLHPLFPPVPWDIRPRRLGHVYHIRQAPLLVRAKGCIHLPRLTHFLVRLSSFATDRSGCLAIPSWYVMFDIGKVPIAYFTL